MSDIVFSHKNTRHRPWSRKRCASCGAWLGPPPAEVTRVIAHSPRARRYTTTLVCRDSGECIDTAEVKIALLRETKGFAGWVDEEDHQDMEIPEGFEEDEDLLGYP